MNCKERDDKNKLYNERQTEVGHPLKTLRGSTVGRSPRYGVGKFIGGAFYFHKFYADEAMDREGYFLFNLALEKCPFEFNCVKHNLNTGDVYLVECPEFDTAREPRVGRMFGIRYDDQTTFVTKSYPQIFHHKWIWVKNDYTGFDISESWEWSKKWLSILKEPADGSNLNNWEQQLKRYNLI